MVFFVGFRSTAVAEHHAHEKHAHGKHAHGHAELSIAFDKEMGSVELQSPGESIIGFEHTAKSDKDKKLQAEALLSLEKNISEMIQFESGLGCVFNKDKIEVRADGPHSDILAVFKVTCAKTPTGSTLTFNIQKYFKKLSDVDVQVLIGPLQKSVEANKVGQKLDLK